MDILQEIRAALAALDKVCTHGRESVKALGAAVVRIEVVEKQISQNREGKKEE